MNKFMLLAARRSGTSFLISSLNSHPQLKCYDDVFRCTPLFKQLLYYEKPGTPFFQYRAGSFKRQFDYFLRRKQLIGAFLTELYHSTPDKKAVIVRIAYPKDYPEALEWALANNVGIIHLIRQNYLKSIVYALASKANSPTLKVSPALLQSRLTARLHQVETYRAMFKGKPYCEVSNEAFETDQQGESARLLDFLAVDSSRPLTFGVIKRSSDSVKDVLENYDEVAEVFKGTVFEKYL